MTKTNVYVDAFNLYYGALRATPYKWLDLAKLCRLLLPKHEIHRIRYFTALVNPRPEDPQQPLRQQVYLRALSTLPNLTIHYGLFLTHAVWMPIADLPSSGQRQYARILKTEEKGSDVNLATSLLTDGFRDDYDAAVIISNDTDLIEPQRVVRHELKKLVGVLHPHTRPSELAKEAHFFKRVRHGALAASQFPPMLTDAHGTFHKPSAW